jgi:glucose-6-phosphate 1-dehydrogenase
MVILGATGDLARRKLLPSLFHLAGDDLLPDGFAILGVGRQRLSDEQFRNTMRDALASEGDRWDRFAERLTYLSVDLDGEGDYRNIADRIATIEAPDGEPRGRLFYLALPPSVYDETIQGLSSSGAMPRREPEDPRWVRVIIEKPYGRSEASARELNRMVRRAVAEHQIYRIDHFLGKETVQNLLVFRFANSIFEPVWNRNCIERVRIEAAETNGIGSRAGYYEEAGVVRDMFQNHLLSLLSLVAMEPPARFAAEEVRDEKVKVLNAIRRFEKDDVAEHAVRGQYGPGTVAGSPVPGYRQEKGVAPASSTPTWAAIRLLIDNWRWAGVPFLLRSGKRLPVRTTDIKVTFRQPPHRLFPVPHPRRPAPNELVFRIQPDEGMSLCFEIKTPGSDVATTSATMDFSYAEGFGSAGHDAYETLLLDCMMGDPMLFLRSDATEAAWRVVDPIIDAWESTPPTDFPNYAAGSSGPRTPFR